MAEITPLLVKELREKTGAGMMDCKKALVEVDGDIEAGIDWLRKKGLSSAEKKSGRTASEGLIGIATKGTSAAMVEVNAETDFVARNTDFQNLVLKTANIAVLEKSVDEKDLGAAAFPGEGETVSGEIIRMVATIGENMNLRRVKFLSVKNGVVASYMHASVAANIGKIGVLVALESDGNQEKLEDLGRKIAMHIAAALPQALSIDDVDADLVARERNVLQDQARASGRPENVIEQMVEGRIRKFYEEIVLLEQVYVIDGKTKIKDVIAEMEKELGTDIKLVAFERYTLGEGIEKEETDFAAEVKAQAGL